MNRLTCGDFGGRNAAGDPCRVAAVDGPCRLHAEQVRKDQMSAVADPEFKFSVDPFKRLHDKVVIVGFTDHRQLALGAPYNDGTWELWGLNELYRYMPVDRFHRWFEIHGRAYLEKEEDGRKHTNDLKKFHIPIYMQQRHEDIPASVMFPADEIVRVLGRDYFTCCPAWMIGQALAMGYESIHMVGVDMAQDGEYVTQRPACEYWLGRAEGAGCDVAVPDLSDLLHCTGRYGYEDSGSKLTRKINERVRWLHEQDNVRLANLRHLSAEYTDKHNGLAEQAAQCRGRIAELERERKSPRRDTRLEELRSELAGIDQTTGRLKAEYEQKNAALLAERNQIVGAINNCDYMLRSWMVRADDPNGSALPDRSKDPRTGITDKTLVLEPLGDGKVPTVPVAVPAGVAD